MNAPALPAAEIVCEGAGRDEWLGLRGLGASTWPAVAGIEGAYGSPLTAYLDIIGEGEPFKETIYTDSGNWYEQRAAERFSHLSGIETIQPPPITMYRSRTHHFATASPDRLTADGAGWVEVKWVGSHRIPAWADGAPAHYIAQVQWGLAVSGLEIGYLFAELGGQDPRWYEVTATEAEREEMFERGAAFWNLVENRTPPEPDGSEATKRAINAQFAAPTLEVVEGGAELAEAVAILSDAQRVAKEATTAQTLAENRVKLILRDAEVGMVDGEQVISWKEQGRRSLDLDAVRTHLGADVSKFEKDATFRVLRIAKEWK